ncbi:MAG: hypothetical protein H6970_03480 [Gammaproteobacteria bacterium]|nr:hypothetical protein [Gammaproteobacteria bacterium]MCP5459512.1 hypothetical protein [Gammaproteobacteria bacterium]
MFDWLLWFTHPGNSKMFSLLLLFPSFCVIMIYVLTGKQRARRLEAYKYIPFLDEPDDRGSSPNQVQDNERKHD